MNLTVVKELPPMQPDQGVSGEVLARTPQPQGIRPHQQQQLNQNRVAAVNRLLQNGLNVPLAYDKPAQYPPVINKERPTVIIGGRPNSASRLQDGLPQQQIKQATGVNQSLPQPHNRVIIGQNTLKSSQGAITRDPPIADPTAHELSVGQSIRLAEAKSLQYLHQQTRTSNSQQRPSASNTCTPQFKNERVVSPPKINRPQPANIYPGTGSGLPESSHFESNFNSLHPNQAGSSVGVNTARMDLRQPVVTSRLPQTHNKSLQQPRHVTHQNPQALNYPKKLASLSRKIDEIVGINECLEVKIEAMREHQETKNQQNARLKKKVAELHERLRVAKKESEDIESAGTLHRNKLEQEITRVRQSYNQTIARLQSELVQARTNTQSLEDNVKNLEKQCRHKDRELTKYRDFFLQMQTGFDSMRDRPQ